MKVFARILSIVGWLLVAASFVGGMLNFSFPTLVPGFILLFFGRMVRSAQKARQTPEPQPVETPRPPQSRRTPPMPVPEPEPSAELAEILAELEHDEPEPKPLVEFEVPLVSDQDSPMSSAEMIARARSRWDRKP